MEPKRISPRSPRAALEPDYVSLPSRPRPPVSTCAQSAGHYWQCDLHTPYSGSHRRGWGARAWQNPPRNAGSVARGQDCSHPTPRRSHGHCRSADARRSDRGAPSDLHWRCVRAQGALGAQGGRIPLHPARKRARCGGDNRRRQGGATPDHRSGRPDVGADRSAASGQRNSFRQHQGGSARRQSSAGRLPFQSGIHARADDPADAPGAGSAAARSVGASQSRSTAQVSRPADYSRLHHREGDRQTGGTHADRSRVRQSPEAEDEAAIGPAPSFTVSSSAKARSAARSAKATSRIRRHTTPMQSTACRQVPSPIPAAPRSRLPQFRHARRSFILSPMVPAAMLLRKPTSNIRRTSRGCGSSSTSREGEAPPPELQTPSTSRVRRRRLRRPRASSAARAAHQRPPELRNSSGSAQWRSRA